MLCRKCKSTLVIKDWVPPEGFDPGMVKGFCRLCKETSFTHFPTTAAKIKDKLRKGKPCQDNRSVTKKSPGSA